MKQCVTSGEVKKKTEFNWRYKEKGIRHPTCRECHKLYGLNWYNSNKEKHLENARERKETVSQQAKKYVWEYFSRHPCTTCGEADPTVLEFNHQQRIRSEISKMTENLSSELVAFTTEELVKGLIYFNPYFPNANI